MIYERGMPASAVYSFSIPDDQVPDTTHIPSGARSASLRAHCITYMSESGDLWVIKDRYGNGPIPRLLLSSTPNSPLAPMPVAASAVNDIRTRFNRGYMLHWRGDLIRDIGTLLKLIDSKSLTMQYTATVTELFPKEVA
jgi:hypothetical protein